MSESASREVEEPLKGIVESPKQIRIQEACSTASDSLSNGSAQVQTAAVMCHRAAETEDTVTTPVTAGNVQ